MRRSIIALCAALAIAVLAGCGGGGNESSSTAADATAAAATTAAQVLSKAEYEKTVAGIGTTVADAFATLATNVKELGASDIQSLDDAQAIFDKMSQEVGGVVDDLKGAASNLETITPPAEVADAQATLVQALQETATEFKSFAAVVKTGDFTKIIDVAGKFQDFGATTAGKLFTKAQAAYEAQGYDISGSTTTG